jgi:branched-chain amino acid transport system permease protein
MSQPCGVFQENYAQDSSIFRTKTQWVLLALFLVILFTGPLYLSNSMMTTITYIGITVIAVHGLNILTGLCGQISMGHAAFMAVGGYTSAILCAKLGFSFWAALPCAALMAGVAGLLFGLPSLKIKGFYLIMATLAAQFIIIWVILQLRDITGGPDGLSTARPQIGDFVFKSKASYYYLVMVFAVAATYFAKNLARSRIGRAFVAIDNNDLAAEVMGVNLWVYKLLAFFIGCMFAGVAGSLTVHYYAFASIDQFPFINSVWYIGMLIVGGMGSTVGAIFGVVFLKIIEELGAMLGPILPTAIFVPQAAASITLLLRGLIIILFLIFQPKGLAHWWNTVKSYYRLWPFSY